MTPNPFMQQIVDTANQYGVDPNLALGVAHQESGMNPNVQDSQAGAMGMFQLMPGTARDLGVDPRDPSQNIVGGVRYLRQMQDRFNGDPALTLAAYNAGPERVNDYVTKGRALPSETQDYVKSIRSRAPMSQAFTGNAPMADNNPFSNLFQPQGDPQQPQSSSPMFGGNPTPIGAVGGIARMLGIGSEPELGRRLQNAGAALMAPGNFGQNGATGAAAMQNAANMPLFRQRFSVGRDALGRNFIVDLRHGQIQYPDQQQGVSGSAPLSAPSGAPQQADPNAIPMSPPSQGEQQTQALANTPVGLVKQNEDAISSSSKKYDALQDSYNQSQQLKQKAEELLKLVQDPNVHQGPGGSTINTLKNAIQGLPVIGSSVMGADQGATAEKDMAQLQGLYLASQKGIRFAKPEIEFGELANPSLDKPRAANVQILQDTIKQAERNMGAYQLASQYRQQNRLLGPQFGADLKKYWDTHPASQLDAVQPAASGSGEPTFKILKVH